MSGRSAIGVLAMATLALGIDAAAHTAGEVARVFAAGSLRAVLVAGEEFVAFLLGSRGQEILVAHGFAPR